MSARLVDRASSLLARRVDRRNVLGKSAIVGSALMVAPLDYTLRPKSAYAAVCACNGSSCDCGSACCDGWTEFCCTLNGANRCPDGTISGGWWKVDGSNFCGGGPRYYLDCNAQCGTCGCGTGGICSGACAGTNCGCANGDCNNRMTGCVEFRYGQCHQDVACMGPIVCRVVTCVAPWLFDPACGTSSRTSEATRHHHRPCLDPQEPFGVVDSVTDVGGAVKVSGWAIDQSPGTEPTRVDIYVDNVKVASTLADRNRPDVGRAFPDFGPNHGFSIVVPAEAGRRLVCVHANDPNSELAKWIGFGYPEVASSQGRIDVTRVTIDGTGQRNLFVGGWVHVPAINPRSPRFRIVVDGEVLHDGVTNHSRPDVAATFDGAGPNLGFGVTVPVAVGSSTVSLQVINGDGSARTLRRQQIPAAEVGSSPPPTTTTTVPPTTTTLPPTTTTLPPATTTTLPPTD